MLLLTTAWKLIQAVLFAESVAGAVRTQVAGAPLQLADAPGLAVGVPVKARPSGRVSLISTPVIDAWVAFLAAMVNVTIAPGSTVPDDVGVVMVGDQVNDFTISTGSFVTHSV